MTNFLRQWDVLKDCPDLPKHRIVKFAILEKSAWLVNDQGRLLVFGKNEDGILGLGHSDPVEECLVEVEALRNKTIVDLAFGYCFVIALTDDAQVWTWGTKRANICLDQPNRADPLIPRLLCTDIASIKCGVNHGLALSKSGKVWFWGCSEYGPFVPVGPPTSNCELVSFPDLHDPVVTKIACGDSHSLVLTQDGKLFAWGDNDFGQLGIEGTYTEASPVRVDLDEDWPKIKDIACGLSHSLVLFENGDIYSAGSGFRGQHGYVREEWDSYDDYWCPILEKVETDVKFQSILCSYDFSAAMAMDGHVHVWGYVNQVVTREVMKTPCKSFAQALLFFHSSRETPRNKLVDNIEPVSSGRYKLSALFNDPTTSDIEFVFDHRSIHAHRQYLTMMSPCLAAMLSEHWEANRKRVEITQYTYPTFLAYIRYLYTGLVFVQSMTTPELIDLLDLATSFVEEPIRLECSEALQSKLGIASACITFQAADQFDLPVLREAAVKFIRNNFEEVSLTEDYRKLGPETALQLDPSNCQICHKVHRPRECRPVSESMPRNKKKLQDDNLGERRKRARK